MNNQYSTNTQAALGNDNSTDESFHGVEESNNNQVKAGAEVEAISIYDNLKQNQKLDSHEIKKQRKLARRQ